MTLEIYVTRPCSLRAVYRTKAILTKHKIRPTFWSLVLRGTIWCQKSHCPHGMNEWGAFAETYFFFYLKCLAERSYVRIKLFHSKFIPMRLMLFTKESTKSTRSEKKMFMQMLWNFQRIFTRARAVKWATLMFIWPLFQESMAVDSE